MGIACEVELNNFLDNLVESSGQQPLVRELYKRSRGTFRWKLEQLPSLLGALPFSSGKPDMISAVDEMYATRGTVVHTGNLSTQGKEIARYWFAAEESFAWTRSERIRLKIGPDLSDIYRSLNQWKKSFCLGLAK